MNSPSLNVNINCNKIPKRGLWSLKGQISNKDRSCPSSQFFHFLRSLCCEIRTGNLYWSSWRCDTFVGLRVLVTILYIYIYIINNGSKTSIHRFIATTLFRMVKGWPHSSGNINSMILILILPDECGHPMTIWNSVVAIKRWIEVLLPLFIIYIYLDRKSVV